MYSGSTKVIVRLGLPPTLLKHIRAGTLHDAVQRAYAQLDELNARLDAWEAANPRVAPLVPWYEGREAWKRAGRPQPPWYEVLRWFDDPRGTPITKKEVRERLLNTNTREHRARVKARKRRQEAAQR